MYKQIAQNKRRTVLIIIGFVILIGAIAIVLLSSYYPAKKASNVDILTTLRNE